MGGIQVEIDGKSIDISGTVQYKGMMLSDVPNFFFATGYTNASWTLKCDLTSEYVCRLINHMDKTKKQQCVPRTGNMSFNRVMSIGLESGYIQRSIDKFPREGEVAPWKLQQSYFLDLLQLRYGSVKDRQMEFSSTTNANKSSKVA